MHFYDTYQQLSPEESAECALHLAECFLELEQNDKAAREIEKAARIYARE